MRHLFLSATLFLLWLSPLPVFAQTHAPLCGTNCQPAASAQSGTTTEHPRLLNSREIAIHIGDSENLLGNISGGLKQGFTTQGVLTISLDIDQRKTTRDHPGTFHASLLQLHGKPLSSTYLDALQAANGNEGENGIRLWELWYAQSFDRNTYNLKIGQQSIDNEFITSDYSGLFINTMAGWPLLPSYDMCGGGPAYPLSSLGARLRFNATHQLKLLIGAFDDNPGGGRFQQDTQKLDNHGVKFSTNTGALIIGEAQFATDLRALSGVVKVGAWYDTGAFPDQYWATDGLSQASPANNHRPLMHRGNYSAYITADQNIWQSSRNTNESVNLFGRFMVAPSDRNFINWSFNGGATETSPLPNRPNDQCGIDVGIGHVGHQAAALDAASGLLAQGTETLIELTYQAQITQHFIIQPVFQYIYHPGGTESNPNSPQQSIGNEIVLGARASVIF